MQKNLGRDKLSFVQKSFRPSTSNLGARVVHGAGYTMLGIGMRTLLTIGSMSILARLLTPADFGHIAMAMIITELAALFSNFGFGSVLVQRRNLSRMHLDTIFWASLALGVLLTVAVYTLALFSGLIFSDAKAGQLLRVLCITFVLEELIVVPNSIMLRCMMFGKLFYIQLLVLLCRAGAAVLFAWAGAGVWSLVWSTLAANLLQLAVYSAVTRYRPRLRFNGQFVRDTWRTTGSYFGGGFLFYINSNIDLFLVGRALGSTSLGFYQNARSLTDEIRARIAQPLQRVLFPAFSAMQDDRERFKDSVVKSGRLLSTIVVPIGFGVAAVADELVPILYGPQWLAMIPVLKIISAGSGIRAAATVATPIFSATNQVGLSFRLNIVSTMLFVASILIGFHWGLSGVAYGLLFNALVALVMYRVALGLIGLGGAALWGMMGWPVMASALFFMAITECRPWIAGSLSAPLERGAALVALGVGLYSLTMLLCARTHVRDVADAGSRFKRR